MRDRLECALLCVGVRACVRRLTIPHAWPTCVRSLSCVRAACVRVHDAAYVAVLHVHSRMCVNVFILGKQ